MLKKGIWGALCSCFPAEAVQAVTLTARNSKNEAEMMEKAAFWKEKMLHEPLESVTGVERGASFTPSMISLSSLPVEN